MPDAPHATSFTVMAGPLKGQCLVVDDTVDEILIGSDAECRLCLDVPGVSPLHARVWIDMDGVTVHDTHSPRGVYVNDTRVTVEAPLADGDVLWLGPPGDAESVMIQFRQPRSAGAPAPPAPVEAPAPTADQDDVMLAGLIAPEEPEVAPPAGPRPDVPGASDAVEDFVYDEPAGIDSGATGAVEFLVDDVPPAPIPAASAPAPPPATARPTAPAPPPAPDEDLFFVDEPAGMDTNPFAGEDAPAPPPPSPPAAVLAPPPVAPPPAPVAPPTPPPVAAAPARASTPSAAPGGAPSRPAPAPPEAPRPRRPRPDVPRPVPRPAAASRGPSVRVLALIAAGVVAIVGGGFALTRFLGAPSIRSIEPGRVRAGDAITLIGRNFSDEAARNLVQFEGSRGGNVLQASSTRLQVQVPDIPSAPGRPNRVPVTVTVDGRRSEPMDIAVYLAPRVHGLAPNVAMPGEEVVLAGTGWSNGATVSFGGRAAEVLETTATALKVRVPELNGPPGTSAPVTVTMAGESSSPVPFLVGHLPLVLSLEPKAVGSGETFVITGRGFQTHTPSNDVRVGGTHALVTAATDAEIRVMVPWVPPGNDVPVDVKVPGSEFVGQAVLAISPAADPIGFRFSAEPLVDAADHDHAILTTGLGPAFVVSAAGGRSAAVRAAEAVRRLNDAAAQLKASLAQDVEMRGLDVGSPAIVLTGTGETLLDITDEDAAAYNEDWTRLRGRGGPVTRARLAVWWGAIARDLVRVLVRAEAPSYTAALAAEGRPLAELHAAARKTGRPGIPRDVVEKARPALRDGLRTMALRVPAGVVAPVDAPASTSAGAAAAGTPATTGSTSAPSVPGLQLEGEWTGRESEGGAPRRVNVTFTREGGTLSYQRALSLSLPLMGVQLDRRGNVHYSMQTARGARYYAGRWDGQKIEGRIFADPEGQEPIGTFTLERIR
jgi:hypothetical protein